MSITATKKSQIFQEIESILEDGLGNQYDELPPATQRRFAYVGERLVLNIESLLQQKKIKPDQLISNIKAWLGIIPHNNKYWVEQEARNKASEILRFTEEQ